MSILKKKPKKAEASPVTPAPVVTYAASNHAHVDTSEKLAALEARLRALEKKLDDHIEWVRKK